ncbi:hypothetical protein [Bosea sp. UNC402CLCol]|uniref:hypothetical protein n=1 Tax=Bosea sp. UNC402CLCol TaxID=1510531 RepID=UPI00056EDC9E|nr:hypothetical protein [Bosea sp. UNC402CLCol]
MVSRLREIAMGRLKPDNGSSVPLADELRAAADALESTSRALSEKEGELAEARARIQALAWEKDVAIIAARDAVLSAIAASPEEGWHYSINFGPDGEANYANVYAPNDAFVGNLKTHHAAMIVAGMNAAASATSQRDEALAALKAAREALEPFARIAEEYADQEDDDFQVWRDFDVLGATLPLRIFRAARSALENGPGGSGHGQ